MSIVVMTCHGASQYLVDLYVRLKKTEEADEVVLLVEGPELLHQSRHRDVMPIQTTPRRLR
jgi:hypothetical protein